MIRRVLFFIVMSTGFMLSVHAETLKLPYTAGESMLASRGYDTPATHLNKDRYALDFVQSGCDSFGAEIRAVRSGSISFINRRDTWGGGYGKNLILDHGNGLVSRYAHLHAYENGMDKGRGVLQGEIIGYQGNTGNVLGTACKKYPGTHLHFSLLQEQLPVKPEPMSAYAHFFAGRWYMSDNVYPPVQSGNSSVSHNRVREDFASRDGEGKEQEIPSGAFTLTDIVIDAAADTKEKEIRVQVKNTGRTAWKPHDVSLNIVGGTQASALFFHESWQTRLRPAVISRQVSPGDTVDLAFVISLPVAEASRVSFQLVFFDGQQFRRIDKKIIHGDIVRQKEVSVMEKEVEDTKESTEEKIIVVSSQPEVAAVYIPEAVPVYTGGYASHIEIASASLSSPDAEEKNSGEKETLALATTSPDYLSLAELQTAATTTTAGADAVLIASSTLPLVETAIESETVQLDCGSGVITYDISKNKMLSSLLSATTTVLLEEGGPYYFDSETIIPKETTLILEKGSVLYGVNSNASIIVEGVMSAKGTDESRVRITSLCDQGGGLDSSPGGWSHLRVEPGGSVSLVKTDVIYAGTPFTISHGALAGAEHVSRVLFNRGGSLALHEVSIEKSYIASDDPRLSAYVWTENVQGYVTAFLSEQSYYSDGNIAIRIEGSNSNQYIDARISGNTFQNFGSDHGPLSFFRDMPQLDGNILIDNARDSIFLEHIQFAGEHTLEAGEYLLSAVAIQPEGALTIPAGTVLTLFPNTDILVEGKMQMFGSDADPVVLRSASTWWGSILFLPGSEGSIRYADISGGGLSASVPTGKNAMIYAVSSTIDIHESYVHDSRVPGGLINAEQARIVVSDSILSWEALPLIASWTSYGIYADGGDIAIDNTLFNNATMPVYATPDTIITKRETEQIGESI